MLSGPHGGCYLVEGLPGFYSVLNREFFYNDSHYCSFRPFRWTAGSEARFTSGEQQPVNSEQEAETV